MANMSRNTMLTEILQPKSLFCRQLIAWSFHFSHRKFSSFIVPNCQIGKTTSTISIIIYETSKN
uniref:Ovule protein n=1 Tax=Ascaris lumbricoides TaxID=6252 RepID=A0A0M3IHC4_ASCLU